MSVGQSEVVMNRPELHFRARLAVLITGGAMVAALFPLAGGVLAAGAATHLAFSTQPVGGVAYGTALSVQPIVQVLDVDGLVVTSAPDDTATITLTLLAPTVGGPGALAGCTAAVNAVAGVATFPACSVSSNSGAGYRLRASATLSVAGAVTVDSAAFTINSAAPTKAVFTTEPVGGTGGLAFGQPVVQIQDGANQIAVQDSASSVALTFGNNPSAGTLTCTGGNSKAVTTGIATFAGCAIDKTGVGYTLTATSGAFTATSAAFTIALGAAAKLVFTQQPVGNVGIGVNLPTQPILAITDAGGNVRTADALPVTLAIKAATPTVGGPGALVCSTNPLTTGSGVATFAGCKINTNSGTGYMLHATSGALAAADSTAFNITSGVATKLAFSTQPGGGTAGLAWTTQPIVQVQDASGNVVITDSTTVVTLAIGTNPGAGTLTCTGGLTKTVVNGQAAFTGCALSKVGTGYTLVATSSPVYTSATSTAFSVVLGTATQLGFTAQPGASSSGVPFTIQPVVAIQDAGGNTITTAPTTTVTLALGANPGTGTLSCTGGNTRLTVSGVATFTGCAINNAGVGYTLVASATGYTSATSTAFTVAAQAASISLVRSAGMVTYGQFVSFTVQFGAGGANRTFFLEHTSVGVPWTVISTLTTNSTGFATFPYNPARTGYYRARFAGTADLAAATSPVVLVGVRQTVTLSPHHAATKTIARKTSVTFSSRVRPVRLDLAATVVTFRFYQKVGKSWVLKNERHVATDSAGVASTTFKFGSAGGWYVRVYSPKTPYNSISRFTQRELYLVR